MKDVEETTLSTTSATFDDGTWYFHLCTRDNAGNWSAAAHAGPYIIEAAPPRAIAVETVADTDDGLLTAGETLVTPITQIVVTFSEPVADPVGDSDPDDVTNPANFQLIRPGVDGTFQTTSCVAVAGDDVKSLPSSVVYLDGQPHGDRELRQQRLAAGVAVSACWSAARPRSSTTPATRSTATPTAPAATTSSCRSRCCRRICCGIRTSTARSALWSALPATPGVVRFDAADSDGWAVSGSVLMEFVAGTPVYGVSQCVQVVDTSNYVFGGLVLTASPSAVDPETFGQVQYFGSTNCTTTVLGSEVLGGLVAGDTGGLWAELPESIHTPPAGARSAYVSFLADAGAAPSFATSFDTLYFRVEVGSLFADGFESGDTTLWSASVP